MSLPDLNLNLANNSSVGPARAGDIGGNTVAFGGIQTGGTTGGTPTWITYAMLAAAAIIGVMLLRKR